MREEPAYARKISPEEARGAYVMVVKNELPFFPHRGETFQLVHDNKLSMARVESYPCTCRGPELPHVHYFIRFKGLRGGDRVEFRRDLKIADRYTVKISRV
jgi:hypothetical protein